MINTRTRSIKKIRPLEDKARTKNTLEYKKLICVVTSMSLQRNCYIIVKIYIIAQN